MQIHAGTRFQAIVGNGELDIAELSLADMDIEDIRAELRRAYTQLEVSFINMLVQLADRLWTGPLMPHIIEPKLES